MQIRFRVAFFRCESSHFTGLAQMGNNLLSVHIHLRTVVKTLAF